MLLTASFLCPVTTLALECGDVDANGVVAASDALIVLRSAVGEPAEMTCEQPAGTLDLEARVTALEEILARFTVDGDKLVLTGMNLQIVNGEDATETANGLGNLILGYDASDENRKGEAIDSKTGSHNLVIGDHHTYTSFAGIVAGEDNAISGPHAAVLGGESNSASGDGAVVVSGIDNEALDHHTAVLAGSLNVAKGESAAIAGGTFNRTFTEDSFIGGGLSNDAQGFASSVTGGEFNRAVGERSSVAGGSNNIALGAASAISGGSMNSTSSFASSVSGGRERSATATWSWRGGGVYWAQ
jgi:hypothetical protein